MKFLQFVLIILVASTTITSCVSTKKFHDIQAKNAELLSNEKECFDDMDMVSNENDQLKAKLDEMQISYVSTNKELALTKDKYSSEQNSKNTISRKYDDLNKQYSGMLTEKEASIAKSNAEINELHTKIAQKESELAQLQSAVETEKQLANNKTAALSSKDAEISQLNSEILRMQNLLAEKDSEISSFETGLAVREARVKQLEQMMAQKDAEAMALRDRIRGALKGFNSNDLTVEEKDGKVYVSLSEKLLFETASADVDPKGKEALGKVAEVLKANEDISILVEGHTDNVPYIGYGKVKDNWDLSVLRATSVTRILTSDYQLPANRVTASGRGEFMPIADNATDAGKSKNRRTDIILTPNMDELMKIIGSDE